MQPALRGVTLPALLLLVLLGCGKTRDEAAIRKEEQAAIDARLDAFKVTLYRVAKTSVRSLPPRDDVARWTAGRESMTREEWASTCRAARSSTFSLDAPGSRKAWSSRSTSWTTPGAGAPRRTQVQGGRRGAAEGGGGDSRGRPDARGGPRGGGEAREGAAGQPLAGRPPGLRGPPGAEGDRRRGRPRRGRGLGRFDARRDGEARHVLGGEVPLHGRRRLKGPRAPRPPPGFSSTVQWRSSHASPS